MSPVSLDAHGDHHRETAGKGSSVGWDSSPSDAVLYEAARGTAPRAGRRRRLLDGRYRRHALFLGTGQPEYPVSPAAAGGGGRDGAGRSEFTGGGRDGFLYAPGADGGAAGADAAAGHIPLLSGDPFPS